MKEDYEIRNEGGTKFCERSRDEKGEIILITPNCVIPLRELQEKAYNPSTVNKGRGKRIESNGFKYKSSKSIYGFQDDMNIK